MCTAPCTVVTVAYVRLLGAVRFVTACGEAVDLPSPAQRRLLAALALAAGATQRPSTSATCWSCPLARCARPSSRLRRRSASGVIETDTAGYRVTCAVDTTMFTDLLVERPASRIAWLHSTRPSPCGTATPSTSSATSRGPRRRSPGWTSCGPLAIEDRAELLIGRSRAGEAVASLEAHIAANPCATDRAGLLMQALASEGRQAEALRAYQAYRQLPG